MYYRTKPQTSSSAFLSARQQPVSTPLTLLSLFLVQATTTAPETQHRHEPRP